MLKKKWVQYTLGGLAFWFLIVDNPATGAKLTHSIFHLLNEAGQGLSQFVSQL